MTWGLINEFNKLIQEATQKEEVGDFWNVVLLSDVEDILDRPSPEWRGASQNY